MKEKTIRFMITVPADIAEKAEKFKKNIFYDTPYAEMYRQLIKLGMEKMEMDTDLETGVITRNNWFLQKQEGRNYQIKPVIID